MEAKFKIGDIFFEELGETYYHTTIIAIAPVDSQGLITYFTRVDYESANSVGFYFDAESEGYLSDCTEKLEV